MWATSLFKNQGTPIPQRAELIGAFWPTPVQCILKLKRNYPQLVVAVVVVDNVDNCKRGFMD